MEGSSTTNVCGDAEVVAEPQSGPDSPHFASETGEPVTERMKLPESAGRPSHVRLRNRATLLVVEGREAGQLHPIPRDRTILLGRGTGIDVSLTDPSISRRHARIVPLGTQYFLEDLESTNGTFVNGAPIFDSVGLRPGDQIQLGHHVVLRFDLHDQREQQTLTDLYHAAVRDPLTGLHNRGYFEDRLEGEVSYAHRQGTPLAVLLGDLDHFKRINDAYGHSAGDAALRVVATLFQRIVRPEDVVARYGGEEFAIVARAVDSRNGMILARRARKAVSQLRLRWDGASLALTMSIGVASLEASTRRVTPEEMLAAADTAMYDAKAAGRNRCALVCLRD